MSHTSQTRRSKLGLSSSGSVWVDFSSGSPTANLAQVRCCHSIVTEAYCDVLMHLLRHAWRADVYDRASLFLDVSAATVYRSVPVSEQFALSFVVRLQSLYRQMDNTNTVRYDNIVIVAHGLFNRLFLMR